jgi:hypothetical protein
MQIAIANASFLLVVLTVTALVAGQAYLLVACSGPLRKTP